MKTVIILFEFRFISEGWKYGDNSSLNLTCTPSCIISIDDYKQTFEQFCFNCMILLLIFSSTET